MGISIATALAVIGVALGIVEIAILGLGTVFLLFIAIGCLLSSLLIYLGLLPETFLVAALSVAVISSASAIILWKPLKRLQSNHQNPDEQPNAFAGLTLELEQDLTDEGNAIQRYSGITWKLFKQQADEQTWAKGTTVEVVKTGVGKMWVTKK